MEISYEIEIAFKKKIKKKDLSAMKNALRTKIPKFKKTGIAIENGVGKLFAIHGPKIFFHVVVSQNTYIEIQLPEDLEEEITYSNTIMNTIISDVFNDRKELISGVVSSIRLESDINKDLVKKYINIQSVNDFGTRTKRKMETGSVGFETHSGEVSETIIFMTIREMNKIFFARTETLKQIPNDYVEDLYDRGKSGLMEIIDSEGVKLVGKEKKN